MYEMDAFGDVWSRVIVLFLEFVHSTAFVFILPHTTFFETHILHSHTLLVPYHDLQSISDFYPISVLFIASNEVYRK